MGKVIEFPDADGLVYINDRDGKCIGVGAVESGVEFINVDDETALVAMGSKAEFISKKILKELMIAWLALNYPDVIKWDED